MAQSLSQADRLSLVIDGLLALEQRLRLGHPTHDAVHDHDEDAHRLAAELRAVFRAPARRTNPPVFVSADGHSAMW